MKNLLFVLFSFFSFFNFLVAQSVGDQKPQGEVFGAQPVWLALNKSDKAKKLAVSEYFSLQQGDQVLCWNAITDGKAEAQVFSLSDFIWVVTRPDGSEFLYKFGCKNRMKYIKILKGATAPAPSSITVYDTTHIKIVEKTIERIVEKPVEDNRVQVGASINHYGTDYWFTESQARFFYFENQEDMRFRTWRPEGRSNACCNGDRLDYSKFVFKPNESRGQKNKIIFKSRKG